MRSRLVNRDPQAFWLIIAMTALQAPSLTVVRREGGRDVRG